MRLNILQKWLILIFILKKVSFSKRILSHHTNFQPCFITKFHNIKKNRENFKKFRNYANDNDGTKDPYDKTVDDFFIKNRIIFLSGELNDKVSFKIITSILRINENDPNLPIKFYINSPGGSVTAGLAIYDLLQSLKMPVETISLGQAASMGAFLLASGTKGRRFAMPNSRIMIHQPLGGAHGQASDIEIQANEILQIRQILNSHLSHFTGKSIETIERDCTRDNYMRPSEAIEYGLVDSIMDTRTSHIVPELDQKI